MRFMLRFPLSLFFLISLIPILVAHGWPDMPGAGDGELLEAPMGFLLMFSYLPIALFHLIGIKFPWSIGVILLCLGLADVRIMRLITRVRSGAPRGS